MRPVPELAFEHEVGYNRNWLLTKNASLCVALSGMQLFSIVAIGCYLELPGFEELLGFEPVVVLESMTISDTSLESGSISMIRSGSFTNSRFLASGT